MVFSLAAREPERARGGAANEADPPAVVLW